MNDMFELADKLKELRDKKQHLAEETKKNNAEIEETEYKLSLEMASSETQSFNRSGTLFYSRSMSIEILYRGNPVFCVNLKFSSKMMI